MTSPKRVPHKVPKGAHRMPTNSIFYDKFVPVLLVSLGVIMVVLILLAGGILLGTV